MLRATSVDFHHDWRLPSEIAQMLLDGSLALNFVVWVAITCF